MANSHIESSSMPQKLRQLQRGLLESKFSRPREQFAEITEPLAENNLNFLPPLDLLPRDLNLAWTRASGLELELEHGPSMEL